MDANFSFLRKRFPVLANFGDLAERYCYTDSNSCLMKLGMIGETIVKLMFSYDNLTPPKEDNAARRIGVLFDEGLITRDIADVFHALRKVRNKAAHENYSSSKEETTTLLQMAYSLCEWFFETYGDWNYQNKPYVLPPEDSRIISPATPKDDAKDEERIRQAVTVAAAAEPVAANERKERARKAADKRIKSEAETRYLVDEALRKVGWEADTVNLCYAKGTRPAKGRNIAIAEWPTQSSVNKSGKGIADYAFFVGTKLVAIAEVKAKHKDVSSVIDNQCKDYAKNIRSDDEKYLLGTWGEFRVPFTFAANGRNYLAQLAAQSGIWFLDLRRPDNAPKALRGWMSPVGLMELPEKNIERGNKKLSTLPYDFLRDKDGLNLREYQLNAIMAVEAAVRRGRQNILLAMATGTGKTRTVLGLIYRFLKTERFRRILFLVDRNALGKQAQDVFGEVKIEDLLTLNEIYNVKGLDDKSIDKETRVQIATVQSMVKRIAYNDETAMPSVSDYDLVIIDEAHRGYILDKEMTEAEILYRDQTDYQSKYRGVIEYFDAVKIALTATPALHTTEIFGEPVFKYSYRDAVIDGFLIDHDAPHKIATKLGTEGIHYRQGDIVAVYDPATGEITNDARLPDELDFDVDNFNRQVITESFNRTVLAEIAKGIDPESPETQGKTLIYAVNDRHADLIVNILKEIYTEYGVDNDAIMKITGSTGDGNQNRIEHAIRRFKNDRFPSVVVTVDLLTTGIDVPQITNLVFMRRVKSRILFEQMLGRATRRCDEIGKNHFEIYDPVGVYDSLEAVNTMKPVVKNPASSLKTLIGTLANMEDAEHIAFQVGQIVAKMHRKIHHMNDTDRERFALKSGDKTPAQVAEEITQAKEPSEKKALVMQYADALKVLDNLTGTGTAVVISDKEDELLSHKRGYGKNNTSRPEDYLEEFAAYLKNNMNEIAALNIVCTRPKDLTRESLKKLRIALAAEGFTSMQINTAIKQTTDKDLIVDIVGLIRRYAIDAKLIGQQERIQNAIKKLKQAHSFSKEELDWLARIEKNFLKEALFNESFFVDDSRYKKDFVKINKAFRGKLKDIVAELNDYLYDDGGNAA